MKVVHCKKEPYDVYIGRPGPYGNPFSHKPSDLVDLDNFRNTREEAIEAFESWLRIQLEVERDFIINEYLRPIAGKTLGCWCVPRNPATGTC